jgi:PAS domain S-box-containing protein/putative nucleotidyltransferase with HDIG domain
MEADNPIRILLLEDLPSDTELAERELRQEGIQFTLVRAETREEFLKALEEFRPDLIISDYALPEFDGMQALKLSKAYDPFLPFIILTGSMNEETAVACIKAGATDYIIKQSMKRLPLSVKEALEQKRIKLAKEGAERAFRESEERYRALFESINDAVFVQYAEGEGSPGCFIQVNNVACQRLGYTREELLGLTARDITTPEEYTRLLDKREKLISTGDIIVETVHVTRDGRQIPVESSVRIFNYLGKQAAISISRDITERKQAADREKLARDVLNLMNYSKGASDTVRDILNLVKKNTGFEAVGIRLREGDDFPHYATNGFSDDFVLAERYLCSHNEAGEVLRDAQGKPILECMCGNILCGRTNPTLPFFTEGGSFWTNSTTELLASTTEKDRQGRTRNRCNSEGYESVALIPLRSDSEIIGLLQLNDRRRNQFNPEIIRFFEGLGSSIGIALSRMRAEAAVWGALERLHRVTGSVINVIVMAVESRDYYTAGHQKRVSDLARAIASEMGLPSQQVEGIRIAGVVHDLGKISIPAEILSMPRKLNEIEYNLVKMHSKNGYDILREVDFDWPVAQMVYQHHERLDGSGYPRGLKGDDIILEARIIGVADVVEAMASHRPYRPALGIETALEEIAGQRGVLYDPIAVDACLRLFREKGYQFLKS